jgi:hypothetical protein
MMPRIEAGERLAAINDRAAAAGNLKQAVSDRLMRRLEEARDGVGRQTAKATPAVLAGMGIAAVNAPLGASGRGLSDG